MFCSVLGFEYFHISNVDFDEFKQPLLDDGNNLVYVKMHVDGAHPHFLINGNSFNVAIRALSLAVYQYPHLVNHCDINLWSIALQYGIHRYQELCAYEKVLCNSQSLSISDIEYLESCQALEAELASKLQGKLEYELSLRPCLSYLDDQPRYEITFETQFVPLSNMREHDIVP